MASNDSEVMSSDCKVKFIYKLINNKYYNCVFKCKKLFFKQKLKTHDILEVFFIKSSIIFKNKTEIHDILGNF